MATIQEVYSWAQAYYRAGNLRLAEQCCQQVLQADQGHGECQHLLGIIAYRTGRHEQALTCFRNAVAVNSQMAGYHVSQGLALEALGRLPEATASYQQSILLEPTSNAHTALANVPLRQGKLAEATDGYRQALQVGPASASVYNNLAIALAQQGQWQQAITAYEEALQINPQFAEAHNGLGHALTRQNRLDDAISCFQRALQLKPQFAEAYCNLGNVLHLQGKLDEAAACYQRALQLKPAYAQTPEFVETCKSVARALITQQKITQAVWWQQEILRFAPHLADVQCGLAHCLLHQGQIDQAIVCYQAALSLDAQCAEAHAGLGCALQRQNRVDDAIHSFRQALHFKPDYPETCNNLGNALERQNKFDEAVHCYQQALRRRPDLIETHNNLGIAFLRQGKLDDALAHYDEAVRLRPDYADAHWNRAMLRLLQGDFERGWPEYEWRWQIADAVRHPFHQPLWDGSDLQGRRILLHAEQGLGDTLQFIRYVSLVKQRGGHVIVECQATLMRLLSNFPGIDQLVARGSPLPAFDVQAPLLSLPGILRTSLTTIPVEVPYLHADPQLTAHWQEALAAIVSDRPDKRVFKIGITWQGNPAVREDRLRSIPLACFAPLAKLPQVQLISLQKGLGVEQLRQTTSFPVVDFGERLDEASGPFMDTAAVMKNVDLVISSDTAVPHLAGALGVPVWVALPLVPDWRWLLQRGDCPWYPTMRLFRQTQLGNWKNVFERMAGAIGQQWPP